MKGNNMLKRFSSYLLVILGCSLTAAAFGLIALPQSFAAGGVTGLSMLLHRVVPVPVSLLVLILNLALFFLGWIFVGKEFVLKSFLSTITYPLMLEVFQKVHVLSDLSGDPLLSSILAGAMLGFGSGLMLLGHGSSGGFDIVGVVANKKWRVSVSLVTYSFDFVIILAYALSTDLLNTVYGLLMIAVAGVVTEKMVLSGKASGKLLIFSQKHEEIREMLLHHHDVGMTFLNGETGLKGEPIRVIVSIIPYRKIEAVKRSVYRIDPTAFLVMESVRHVAGRGYTIDRYQ